MSILNVFKKQKKDEKKTLSENKKGVLAGKSPAVLPQKKLERHEKALTVREEKTGGLVREVKEGEEALVREEVKVSKASKGNIKIAHNFLKSAHITEKATNLQMANQYVFKIFDTANKTEVKKSVEEVYGVDVVGVRIVRVPKKPRRLGRSSGWRKSYKKAIVHVRAGQSIDLLPR